MSQRNPEEKRLDLFRAQMRTGMGQAAEMLSKFLEPGYKFRIELIETQGSALNRIPDQQDQTLAGVCLDVEGAVSGSILLLFSVENACRLAGLLLRRDPPADLDGNPLRSTLQEFGNIFASGLLQSLDERINLRALPSPPTFLTGTRVQIQGQCLDRCRQPGIVPVEARLDGDAPDRGGIEGMITFQTTSATLEKIVAAGNLSGIDPQVSS